MGFRIFHLIILILIFGNQRMAAQDIEGSTDHPLFNRIPGFSINNYMVEDPGIYNFFIEEDHEISPEGKKTTIHYKCNCQESPLRIIRNFSDEIKKIGGKSLEYSDNRIYINVRKDGTEYWAEVYAGEDYYFLTIIESKIDTGNSLDQ
jgi:hypothetical protein